jgi:hypothetical protein
MAFLSWLRSAPQIAIVLTLCLSLLCDASPRRWERSLQLLPPNHTNLTTPPAVFSSNLGIVVDNTSTLFRRAESQDPSCPVGFLCVEEACPADVFCASGETCVNFEGTIACVQTGTQWCALNPSTFEGVGCISSGGLCW